MPKAYQNEADVLPAFFRRGSRQSIVNVRYQLEYRLDPVITQRCFTILDLTELSIREHDLQDGIEDVTLAIHFLLDHLIDSIYAVHLY